MAAPGPADIGAGAGVATLELLAYTFPVSGVHTALWLPPLAAFLVSFFSSMVGISGAFLLLPFQMSVLQYTAPSVSATNLVYNLVATPGGVYRYWREGRLCWPLLGVLALGTLPGVLAGFYLRVHVLADPRDFQVFVALVLLYLAYRLARRPRAAPGEGDARLLGEDLGETPRPDPMPSAGEQNAPAGGGSRSGTGAEGARPALSFPTARVAAMAAAIGVVGGVYGIGGGALVAPLLVGVFRLPVYAVAGATLAATFLTSALGIAAYSLLPAPAGIATGPDWPLGALFGLGGLLGTYAGARVQHRVPERALRVGLALVLLVLGLEYLIAALPAIQGLTTGTAMG